MNTPTILIGEDDEFLLQLVKMAFVMEGFRVQVARDGPTALALLRSSPPDAALLDVVLPGSSGCEVLQALRASETEAAVPVALMSAGDVPGCATDCAQAFVRKPFTLASLVRTMKRLMAPGPSTAVA